MGNRYNLDKVFKNILHSTVYGERLTDRPMIYLDNASLPISAPFGEILAQRAFTVSLSLAERLMLSEQKFQG